MAVQNLQPGGIKNVAANEIQGTVYIYRTSDGYPDPGDVGWLPNNGPLQQQTLAVGHHAQFAINGNAGMIANGCPSKVQLLWDNAAAVEPESMTPNAAEKILKKDAATRSAAALGASLGSGPADEAMQTLTKQWYNAVVTGCGLDPGSFQLIQAHQQVGSTSEQMWNIFDVVPPLSVSNYYNPSQANVFSTDYGGVINNLNPQNASKFQNDMGDYYAQWTAYLKTDPKMPQGGILALFKNWSEMHMPPGQAQTCYTDYQQISQGVVTVAVQMWLNAGGGTGGVKAYNATIDQLKSQLQSAPPKSFQMNSFNESSDISNTWAKAEAAGIFDIFGAGGDTSYSQMTVAIATAGVTIDASFQRLLSFPAAPLSKTSSDPILSQYEPWYSSAALNLAYQNNNNVVWAHTPPTWQDTFGPKGNMLRTTSSLVIVDGINITMKSNVGFSSAEQQQFKAAAEAGLWPFFEVSASGGWSQDISFDTSGNITIKSSCPTGNPYILGAIVTPIGGVLML